MRNKSINPKKQTVTGVFKQKGQCYMRHNSGTFRIWRLLFGWGPLGASIGKEKGYHRIGLFTFHFVVEAWDKEWPFITGMLFNVNSDGICGPYSKGSRKLF